MVGLETGPSSVIEIIGSSLCLDERWDSLSDRTPTDDTSRETCLSDPVFGSVLYIFTVPLDGGIVSKFIILSIINNSYEYTRSNDIFYVIHVIE